MPTTETGTRIVFKAWDVANATPANPKFHVWPIVLDHERITEDWLERYMPLNTVQPFGARIHDQSFSDNFGRRAQTDSFASGRPYRGGLEPPNWSTPPEIRINQLYWPTGAERWSVGRFLVSETDAQGMLAWIANQGGPIYNDQAAGHARWITLAADNAEVTFADDGTITNEVYTPISEWMALPVEFRPIGSEGEKLWLVTTTDVRWYQHGASRGVWASTGDPPQVSDVEFVTLPFAAGDGATITPIPGAETVDWVETSFTQTGAQQWQLDALADSHGNRIVFEKGGHLRADTPASAAAVVATNNPDNEYRIAGGAIPSPVAFPKRMRVITNEKQGDILAAPLARDGAYEFTVEENNAISFPDINDREPISWQLDSSWDNTEPDYLSAADYRNDAHTVHTELVDRMRAWNATRYDYTFDGIVDWEMCGFDDFALWCFGIQHWREEIDATSDIVDHVDAIVQTELDSVWHTLIWTRVVSHPIDRLPRRVSLRSPAYARYNRNARVIIGTVAAGYVPADPNGPPGAIVTLSDWFDGEKPTDDGRVLVLDNVAAPALPLLQVGSVVTARWDEKKDAYIIVGWIYSPNELPKLP